MSAIKARPSGQAFGAEIIGIDLTEPLDTEDVRAIRDIWLEHHVVSFPNQNLTDDDLERFALYFGDFGDDAFFGPIEGREHIAAVLREAEDTNPIFADVWHSDWSFQESPPSGTVLYGIDIPPVGGDTLFANQHLALSEMPERLRTKLEGKTAIHSAVLGYAPNTGVYGTKERIGSMDIRPSDEAYKRQPHHLFRNHAENGRPGIFSAPFAYIVEFEGMADELALPLLKELLQWQTQDQFIYRHKWQSNMLVMWDNRSVLHRATGGYEGYRRELHRITIR